MLSSPLAANLRNGHLDQANDDLSKANTHLTTANLDLAKANADLSAERDRAEIFLIDGLLRTIGHSSNARSWKNSFDVEFFLRGRQSLREREDVLDPAESRALAEVARLPDRRLRLRFLERGLEEPETAARLGRRSKTVVKAIVGQDAACRAQVRKLLLSRLEHRRKDLDIALACAWLGLALGEMGPQFAKEAIEVFAEAIDGTSDPHVLSLQAEAVGDLAGEIDQPKAAQLSRRAAARTLGKMETADLFALCDLAQAFGALAKRLDASGAREGASKALDKMSSLARNNSSGLGVIRSPDLEGAVIVLAGKLDTEGANEIAPKVLAVIDQVSSMIGSYYRPQLGQSLRILALKMDARGARETAPKLLSVMSRITYFSSRPDRASEEAAVAYALGLLVKRMNRPDLLSFLTEHTFTPRASTAILRQLEPLATQRLDSVNDAVRWLRSFDADPPAPSEKLALAYLGAGDVVAYRRFCEVLLARSSPQAKVNVALLALRPDLLQALTGSVTAHAVAASRSWDRAAVARVCTVRPDAVVDPSRLLHLITEPDDPVTRGAVLCRALRFHDALKLLRDKNDPAALLYLALAEYGLGRKEAARTALEQAVKWLEAPPDKGPLELTNAQQLTWQQRLEVDVLRREVQALLQPGDREKRPAP